MMLSSRSYVDPIDPDQVLPWVKAQFVSQCFQAAIVTVLVYDALITMDKEMKYFWRPTEEYGKQNRYTGIFGAVAFIFCNFAQWTKNIANILMIRVLALYSQGLLKMQYAEPLAHVIPDRTLSICLKMLLALSAGSKLGLVLYINYSVDVGISSLPGDVVVCSQDGFVSWQWGVVDWILPMAYGVILNVLALYKAAEYWRLSAGFKGFTLVRVLIQDQLLYFAIVIACCMFNIMEFRLQFSSDFLSNVFNAFGNPAFLSVLGSRMLFNLKVAGERGQNQGTSYRVPSRTASVIDFVVPLDLQRDLNSESLIENRGSA
ncbi:hypothetical protein A7U60_g5669 [Sanghuangporus baumii]|uniref:DUF6533 domain-containing protein n=1 Tax=Sanghuangporus baumii TaxID=108892 RepID=A0A9Q5HWI5_SANBA|nr:hypothetical protein A7U60_g5669 [Sanghuangporus baumii]